MSTIHPITGQTATIETLKCNKIFYGKNGSVSCDKEAYAFSSKTIEKDHISNRFFIKIGQRGEVQDPWSYNTDLSGKNKNMGLKYWSYRKVTKKTFDVYKKFLETRNQRFLRATEKLINSGD